MPSLVSYLLRGSLLLSITPFVSAVIHQQIPLRTSHVMNYVQSQQELPWEQLDDTTRHVSFSNEEWTFWETQTRVHTNLTDDTGGTIPDNIAHLTFTDPQDLVDLSKRVSFMDVACYGSGSWARQITISNVLGGICAGFTYGLGVGGVQILETAGLTNEAGNDMKLVTRLAIATASTASSSTCGSALSKVISDYCTGKYSDTRGGSIKDDSGNEYSTDPTTLNCNC